jgi:hypothetical protein
MTKRNTVHRLTSFPVAARARGAVCPIYRSLRDLAVDGKLPAHQRNGVWHYYEEDMDVMIAALSADHGDMRAA